MAAPAPVRRRKVFYVAGFDPASPRRYHAIFEAEAAKQAAVTGVAIAVGPLEARGDLAGGWSVAAAYDGRPVEVDYECLRWNDIVRAHWSPEAMLFPDAWRSLLAYGRSGILGLGWREAKLLVVASVMPVVASSLFLLLYGLAVWGLCVAAGAVATGQGGPAWVRFLPLALLPFAPLAWRQVDRLVPLNWLIRGMVFVSRARTGAHDAIETRCGLFGDRIRTAAREPGWDEILVVGHSVGAQLAARALGKALALDPALGREGPRVGLLTLGQLIPLYSLSLADPAFAADLRALAEARQIAWLDVESPADAGSVCGLHPLTGLAIAPAPGRPTALSPRFHRQMSRPAYDRLRRRPLDFHFHYIKAMEVDGDYDFFRFIAGPDALSAARSRPTARPQS
jgi:hypothetical protein